MQIRETEWSPRSGAVRAWALLLFLGLPSCATARSGAGSVSTAAADDARTPARSTTPRPSRGSEPPALLPLAGLSQLDLEQRLGVYEARGAAWVPDQPILVNRDFDFGTALGLEGIGPAVAFVKRRDANAALVARLAALPPVDPAVLLDALCSAPPGSVCAQLAGRNVRIYGLLFGEQDARLQVVLEVHQHEGAPDLYAAITAARSADAFLEPGVAAAAFTTGLEAIAPWIGDGSEATAEDGSCKVGGATKLQGKVVRSSAAQALLLVGGPQPRRVICPGEAFEVVAPPTANGPAPP